MFFGDQYHKLCDLVADNNFSVPQDWLMEITSAVCKCARRECAKGGTRKA